MKQTVTDILLFHNLDYLYDKANTNDNRIQLIQRIHQYLMLNLL